MLIKRIHGFELLLLRPFKIINLKSKIVNSNGFTGRDRGITQRREINFI